MLNFLSSNSDRYFMQVHGGRRQKIISAAGIMVGFPIAVLFSVIATLGGYWKGFPLLPSVIFAFIAGFCAGVGVFSILGFVLTRKSVPAIIEISPSGVGSDNVPQSARVEDSLTVKTLERTNFPPSPPSTDCETSSIKSTGEFLASIIQLGNMAKENQELVENEVDLVKKEQVRLSLRRREFRQLYQNIKFSNFESF
jgi:hypothetical protein